MNVDSAKLEHRPVASLTPYGRNPRTHSRTQVRQIADSIRRFGFTNPVLISDQDEIVAGHGRVMAAKELGMSHVPVIRLSHLTAAERRAYVIADNKLALNAGWDFELLAGELQGLIVDGIDLELTGFAVTEIDQILREVDRGATDDRAEECLPVAPCGPPVTRLGDVWRLGRHRLVCGDARDNGAYRLALGKERADLIFTDPPYNVPIDGHVSGLGRQRHREFAMATGEMSEVAFTQFLTETMTCAAASCRDGAIAYVCMDWRHMSELLAAGREAFSELKNVCVWNKTNAGMGTFYRSKHELVFVFKVGQAPHTNNFGLGETGRYRTNVWDYAGVNAFGSQREAELAMHPTVKPVALVADAIRDCTKRGETVLDPFGGSGSTMIAAESCGRRAALIEIDPLYCDTIIRRWQSITGQTAWRNGDESRFEDAAALVSIGSDGEPSSECGAARPFQPARQRPISPATTDLKNPEEQRKLADRTFHDRL